MNMLRCLQYIYATLILCIYNVQGYHANDYELQKFLCERTQEGHFNNPTHPDWGAVEALIEHSHERQHVNIEEFTKRVNPRHVSSTFFRDKRSTRDQSAKSKKFTALFGFFGQLVAQEIVDIETPSCPREIVGINVTEDPVYSEHLGQGKEILMPFYRADYDKKTGVNIGVPRGQKNQVTSWIDGGFIYGSSELWCDSLRKRKFGMFDVTSFDLPPLNEAGLPLLNKPIPRTGKLTRPRDFWVTGSRSAHENPAVLSLSILFMRYHNKLADKYSRNERIDRQNDQATFNKTRARVTATLQSIIFYEWLPVLLGEAVEPYSGYKPEIIPAIDNAYASTASQWILTLLPSYIQTRSPKTCEIDRSVRMCNSWYDGQSIIKNGTNRNADMVQNILLGLSSQPAELEDAFVVEDFLDYDAGPLHFTRTDAMAKTIMKGRDAGLNNHALDDLIGNSTLSAEKLNEFLRHLNVDLSESITDMLNLYGFGKAADLLPMLMLEREADGSAPGHYTKTIVKMQLQRLRDSDRWWFENRRNELFTEKEIAEIRSTSLHDVMVEVFGEDDTLTKAMFMMPSATCHLPPLNSTQLKALGKCIPAKTYDYFSGNELAFIFSWIWIGLFPLVILGIAYSIYRYRHKKTLPATSTSGFYNEDLEPANLSFNERYAWEWDEDKPLQPVIVRFDENCRLTIMNLEHKVQRAVNLSVYDIITTQTCDVEVPAMLLIQAPKEYDLVLCFPSSDQLILFTKHLRSFLKKSEKVMVRNASTNRKIRKSALTRQKRKGRLDEFFRRVFAQAFNVEAEESGTKVTDRALVDFEISKDEFADALGMKSNSTFVSRMFDTTDKRKLGFLRFRDILELVVIMSRGSANRKLEMLFEMFDFDKSGSLHRDEMAHLARSLIDVAGSKFSNDELDHIVDDMFRQAGCGDKVEIDFDDFKQIMAKDEDLMEHIGVDWKGVKTKQDTRAQSQKTAVTSKFSDPMDSILHSNKSVRRKRDDKKKARLEVSGSSSDEDWESRRPSVATSGHQTLTGMRSLSLTPPKFVALVKWDKTMAALHWMENRKREIAILFVYYAFCGYFFGERFIYYYTHTEHIGARQTLSLGVCFARGAAECMSFSFSLMMLTMCYNLVRYLRETFINLYIPFDKNIVFHKIIAWTAIAFTGVHCVAYGFNYYYLASGPAHHACFFDELYYPSDGFIKVGATLYTTTPGVTGILLILILYTMYIFASQTARRYMHQTFWISHKLFIVLYILMAVHGLSWLTQKPNFPYHVIGPGVAYVIDKLLSVTRRKMKLSILNAELLPSNVTKVMFKRPPSFEYKSGMWVRIAVDALGKSEYHPFTLTSSPHEDFLSLHVRGVGPWTKNLRKTLGKCTGEYDYPSVYVDGPFGSGQQDWFNFEVSVLVGAGIGVTPYASILKDFVHMMKTKNRFKIQCKKVYFIWSTSNQRSFEWLIDILKQVEEVDTGNTVSINIFITQFFKSFDLRTSMLYVFEEHSKKLGGASLFTGLRATTNFGRPNFLEAFHKISDSHLKVKKIGVFSCGPPGITKGVETASIQASAETRALFQHHYENF